MGRIITIDESNLTPEHKQLAFKLSQVNNYIEQAISGYHMVNRCQDTEEGMFLIINGLSFARDFNRDALMITRGPDFIDWM